MAWLTGVRVLEAIGVAFSKNKKYSEEPRLKTRQEVEQEQEQAFNNFVKQAQIIFKGKGR